MSAGSANRTPDSREGLVPAAARRASLWAAVGVLLWIAAWTLHAVRPAVGDPPSPGWSRLAAGLLVGTGMLGLVVVGRALARQFRALGPSGWNRWARIASTGLAVAGGIISGFLIVDALEVYYGLEDYPQVIIWVPLLAALPVLGAATLFLAFALFRAWTGWSRYPAALIPLGGAVWVALSLGPLDAMPGRLLVRCVALGMIIAGWAGILASLWWRARPAPGNAGVHPAPRSVSGSP